MFKNADILNGLNLFKEQENTSNKGLSFKIRVARVRTGYLINNKYSYTEYDFGKEVITRYNTPGVLDLSLVYQANTLNLLSRKDNIRNITETFTYDTHDRLTSAMVNGVQQFAMSYDAGAQGKILQKTDIGNYSYDAQKIHQLKYLTPISGGADPTTIIGVNTRDIAYTPFLKTQSVIEDGYELTYTYGSDRQRLTSTLKQNGATIESKIYWGNMEVVTKGGVTSEIYYIAGPAGLTNIIVKKSGVISMYNAYTDQLGSILAVTTGSGGMVAEQNFDAWGRNRNPNDWGYSNVPVNPDWLYRGYTGHEHLTAFRLINMNGRMYDPMTGLMLSPDNHVPMPWSPGGYNRYGYANGNPLKYVDPDGEFFWLAIPIFAGINLVGDLIRNDFKMSLGQIGLSLLKGAAQGALAGAGGPIGGGITTWQGAVVSAASSQLPGISVPLGGGFSLSLNPSLAFGTNGLSFGGNVGVSGSVGDFGFGVGMGFGKTVKAFDQGSKGWYRTIGGSFGIGGASVSLTGVKGDGAKYYDQVIKGFSYNSRSGFSFSIYNDMGMFGIKGSDKGRTASAQLGYKGFNIGFQVISTDHSDFTEAAKNSSSWVSRTWGKLFGNNPAGVYDDNSKRITSPFYFGYSGANGFNYRIGIDAPLVQDFFQNGLHRLIGSPWFRTDYDTPSRLYTFYGNTLPYFF